MRNRILPLLVLTSIVIGVSAPAGARVAPVFGPLPDGDFRPVVESAELLSPQRHNAILEADLTIEAHDNNGITGYEYRWVGEHGEEIVRVGHENPTVSFEAVLPEAHYALQVRAIDTNGWTSEWHDTWEGTTPPPPNVIVVGDSVASGYTRQWFTGSATCRDDAYAYGRTVATSVAESLPQPWAPRYQNIAWPGAGIGEVLSGGTDSCSEPHGSQIDDVVAIANPETWNVVVVTAGINSTNWTSVVAELVKNTALSLTDSGDKEWCRVAVDDHWNLDDRTRHITGAARDVVERITAETNADLHWTSYYSLSGTKLVGAWTPIGAECEEEMGEALERLNTAILTGIDGDATWIDVTGATVATQRWAGWPHPDRAGHAALGDWISRTVIG